MKTRLKRASGTENSLFRSVIWAKCVNTRTCDKGKKFIHSSLLKSRAVRNGLKIILHAYTFLWCFWVVRPSLVKALSPGISLNLVEMFTWYWNLLKSTSEIVGLGECNDVFIQIPRCQYCTDAYQYSTLIQWDFW